MGTSRHRLKKTRIIHAASFALILAVLGNSPASSEIIYKSEKVEVRKAPESWYRGAKDRNIAVLRLGQQVILVDPGIETWFDRLVETYPVIDQAWITHAHPDHAALARKLQRERGARILSSEEAAKLLRRPGTFLQEEYDAAGAFRNQLLPRLLRPFMPLFLRVAYGPWPSVEVDATFESLGMSVEGAEVVRLPGHTSGSVGFVVADQAITSLVIGDVIQKRGGKFVLSMNLPSADLDSCLASASRLLGIRPDVLIPAHGDIVQDASSVETGLHALIDEYQSYREAIGEFLAERPSLPSIAQIEKEVPLGWPDAYRPSFTQRRATVYAVLKSLAGEGGLPPSISDDLSR